MDLIHQGDCSHLLTCAHYFTVPQPAHTHRYNNPSSAGGIIECARGGKRGEENGERSEPEGRRRGGRRRRKEMINVQLRRFRSHIVVLSMMSLVMLTLLLLTYPLVLIVNFVVVNQRTEFDVRFT